ncbi:hypothetical protein T11_14248 [Trichinella zimbabwensis]|uniref:Uncharacterized protein n=1 Tax=Trichinella zimbabwensis TaxID=268475 RepID=A0A0V1HSB7_9BILA|nr:hypothetical protein T11_14248 [Trichinella zimbabwensis]
MNITVAKPYWTDDRVKKYLSKQEEEEEEEEDEEEAIQKLKPDTGHLINALKVLWSNFACGNVDVQRNNNNNNNNNNKSDQHYQIQYI